MKILYYISPFGFGHLTRSLAVIEAMLLCAPELFVSIKCQLRHRRFAAAYLESFADRIEYLDFSSSFSIVFDQESLAVDIAATRRDTLRWVDGLAASAVREISEIKGSYDLVVSDIVPEAFKVAEKLAVPGIALSNFTWFEICRSFCTEAELAPLRQQYALATLQLEYGLSTGDLSPIVRREAAGLVSRPFAAKRIAEIRELYKKPGRPLIFLSIGGALELQGLSLPKTADFLYTQGIGLKNAENAIQLPSDLLDTQNYLAACDGVVTKCGWSTVSETLLAGNALLLLRSSNGWLEEEAILKGVSGSKQVAVFHAAADGNMPEDWLEPLLERTHEVVFEKEFNSVDKIAERLLTFNISNQAGKQQG